MSTKVIIGLNIVFSIIVLVLWQRYSDVISRWETDHAIQVTAIAQQQMTATAQFKVVMATGTVEAQKLTNLAEQKQDTEQQYQHTEQKYQKTLAQKLGAEAQLRLNDQADPTLGTLLALESMQRYQTSEANTALQRGLELMSWRPIFTNAYGTVSLAFSPDKQYLIAQACQRLSRNLTEAEWQQYLGDEPYRKTCPNLEEK